MRNARCHTYRPWRHAAAKASDRPGAARPGRERVTEWRRRRPVWQAHHPHAIARMPSPAQSLAASPGPRRRSRHAGRGTGCLAFVAYWS